MDIDRPFICNGCKNTFKLKWHLKTHTKTCKGNENELILICDHCEKRFASKRTLKFHRKTCLPGKSYLCQVCNLKFAIFKEFNDHKRKYHTSLQCDYCDKTIASAKNMKRHVNSKHTGLTPSIAKELEKGKLSRSKKSLVKCFKCEECEKTFFDKSTLNRHKKLHTFLCKTCGKTFQFKDDLKNHKRSHIEAKDCNIIDVSGDVAKRKKNVFWATELENVKEIPCTKLAFKFDTKTEIKNMFTTIESFMPLYANQGRSIKMDKFIETYERISKKNFDEVVFRALLSIFPDSYKVELTRNVPYVRLDGEAKPSIVMERQEVFEKILCELEKENTRYIDLVELEERKEELYKNAKQTIVDNIVKFSDDDEDLEEIGPEPIFSSTFEKLKYSIQKKSMKKNRRALKIKQIDWQLQRLGGLTTLINKVFVAEKKTALKMDFLMEKLRLSDYSCDTIKNDIERLIKNSNGWLKFWKGWIKKNSAMNVSNVVKLF